MSAGFATVVVVPVMLRVSCSLSCYVVLHSVIMFYLLVFPFICLCLLVVHVDVGDGLQCMTVVCPDAVFMHVLLHSLG